MVRLPDLRNADLKGKRVFLRADLDVPVSEVGSVVDDTRLVAWLPTLEHLLNNGAKVVVAGHLGRPSPISNHQSPVSNEFSLEHVAKWIVSQFKVSSDAKAMADRQSSKFKVQEFEEFTGWKLAENLVLLENLRFYDGEETNDQEFSKKLASLADIYVNDAFAVSHRAHASIVGVANLLPHFAGLRLQEEITTLSKILDNPIRPLTVVIGGKKIETKLPLVKKMENFADNVLVGGMIAGEIRDLGHVSDSVDIAVLTPDKEDITEESLANFIVKISSSKTVVWNGPVHKISNIKYQISNSTTARLAQGIVDSGAYSVIGGGDTARFVKQIGIFDKFSFVSTGGGAMLSFLSGEKLPGLEVLQISVAS